MTKTSFKNIGWPLLIVLIMIMLVWSIGAQTPRTDFVLFISQYLLLFVAFYILWLNKWGLGFWQFFGIAVILRLLLINVAPELSNDFYRFIWDGELMTKGINPFAHTPNELISNALFFEDGYMRVLYHGMGELSQSHYTCYPVLNQFLFFIPAYLSDSLIYNIIGLKIIVILADIGAIIIAKKIAEHLKVSVHNIWLYALNPFIILEFSGNLHFEGVMIFFLLGAIYLIMKNKWIGGGVLFGLAIQIKLIPLMLIPFVFKKLKWKKSVGFMAMTGLVVMAIGGLMLNQQFFNNMMESVNEYFVRFQFNSSFYKLIVNFGYTETDYDRFSIVGKGLSYIATGGILLLALLKAYRNDLDIIKGMLFAFMIYYSLATTIHPWYISLILVLSVFTKYKFGVVWSIIIMISYYSYTLAKPDENSTLMILTVFEYVVIYSLLIYEIRKNWNKKAIGIQLKSFFGIN